MSVIAVVVEAIIVILGRISGRGEIRGADCTMVRSWMMFSIISWRKWFRLGGLVSGVSVANGEVSTLRGGGIGKLTLRDEGEGAAGVWRGLHLQRSGSSVGARSIGRSVGARSIGRRVGKRVDKRVGRSVGRRGVSRGRHPQRSGRSVGGSRIGRRVGRPVDTSVGRPVGGRVGERVCCFAR